MSHRAHPVPTLRPPLGSVQPPIPSENEVGNRNPESPPAGGCGVHCTAWRGQSSEHGIILLFMGGQSSGGWAGPQVMTGGVPERLRAEQGKVGRWRWGTGRQVSRLRGGKQELASWMLNGPGGCPGEDGRDRGCLECWAPAPALSAAGRRVGWSCAFPALFLTTYLQ